MAEKKRQCGTCRFFIEKDKGGHGTCSHPKRAGADTALLLLRPNELACRTRWGTSLWQDPADDSDPNEQKSPQQPTLPEPVAAQLQFDDEVTSVSIAGSKTSRPSFEDDVVDSGAVGSGMASWNDPIQDERLSLLRRGSQDALAGARKRHMEKQARQRDLIPFAEDDEPEAITSESKPEPAPAIEEKAPVEESAALSTPPFPPDDFVEDERTTAEDDSNNDDEMVDEGVTPTRSRSPRLNKLLREPNDPKKNEAMRASMPSEMRVTSHNPEQRGQWNSVPTLDPGFELPLMKREDSAPTAPIKVAASAAPVATSSYQPRPVSQARELLSEDRLRQERAQRHTIAPLADETRKRQPERSLSQTVTDRPRLTEAPSRSSAPLEQIKSSPLRGYHPATRKLTQTAPVPERPVQTASAPTSRSAQSRPEPQREARTVTQEVQRPAAPIQQPQQRPEQARAQQRTGQMVEPRRRRSDEQSQNRAVQSEQYVQERPYIPVYADNTPFEREEIEISPSVPRACGTCTSYRASKVPGRGSCTNAFAGPVERVVYEQSLSCQHTYGSFWLPADEEVWLEDLETDYPPTPRVDAMLARRRRKATTVLPDLEELTS